MERKKIRYSEGDIFIINVNENKYIGLIALRKGRTKLLLGYFWKFINGINPDSILKKEDPILITKFSGLGFEIGNWEILGVYSDWNKVDWRMPEFKRFDPMSKKSSAISYNEKFEEISDRKITDLEAKTLFDDGSHGYISLENHLNLLLSEIPY